MESFHIRQKCVKWFSQYDLEACSVNLELSPKLFICSEIIWKLWWVVLKFVVVTWPHPKLFATLQVRSGRKFEDLKEPYFYNKSRQRIFCLIFMRPCLTIIGTRYILVIRKQWSQKIKDLSADIDLHFTKMQRQQKEVVTLIQGSLLNQKTKKENRRRSLMVDNCGEQRLIKRTTFNIYILIRYLDSSRKIIIRLEVIRVTVLAKFFQIERV